MSGSSLIRAMALTIVLFSLLEAQEIPLAAPQPSLTIPEFLFDSWRNEFLDPNGDGELQPFIVNGQETGDSLYQGVVGLILNTSQGQAICTSTLIDPEVLLTAGHCVYLKENGVLVYDAVSNPSSVQIYGGSSIMGWSATKLANASQVVKHSTWTGDINTWGENTDLALIKLDRKITSIDFYGIRNNPEESIGEQGIIVGYGITSTNAYDSGTRRWGYASVLQKGTLMGKPNLLEIGDPSGTCQGDSGGPFFTTQNGQLVVSGVTSFGGQYCYADHGGYDTWVLKYRSWIESIVQQFTGHGLLSSGICGDGDDYCSPGQTKDCGLIDSHYESGTAAPCNSGCTYWDTSVCTPKCGDGFVLSPEVCEAGDYKDCAELGQYVGGVNAPCSDDCMSYNTNYCTATVCGDGVKEGNEFCDSQLTSCETLGDYPKNYYARCNSTCTAFDVNDCVNGAIICGNGVVDPLEQCDDGNTTSGDGCSSKCKLEGSAAPVCGNGIKETGEECDDGNTVSGDGCSAGCKTETTTAVCGNGIKETGEQCDDGNTTSGDGCSANCTTETPSAVCGNGIQETGEECDDGNTTSGDGCSAACLTEDPNAVCGNGVKEQGEACDDGNMIPGDGCEPNCTLTPTPQECGNGIKEGTEQCDDGNLIPGDGCDPDCTLTSTGNEVCGNGIIEAGEECDDGNLVPGDGCNPDCTYPRTPQEGSGSGGCGCSLVF